MLPCIFTLILDFHEKLVSFLQNREEFDVVEVLVDPILLHLIRVLFESVYSGEVVGLGIEGIRLGIDDGVGLGIGGFGKLRSGFG